MKMREQPPAIQNSWIFSVTRTECTEIDVFQQPIARRDSHRAVAAELPSTCFVDSVWP